MDSKRFSEYKAVIEEAIQQAVLVENVTIHAGPSPNDIAIFLTTTRARECVLLVDGTEIQVLKRVQHSPDGTSSFKTYNVVNLAQPGSVLQLGIAIKDLLSFNYWSKTDELG